MREKDSFSLPQLLPLPLTQTPMFPSGPLFEEVRSLPANSGDAFCDALRERLLAAYPGAAVQEARAAVSALSEHS